MQQRSVQAEPQPPSSCLGPLALQGFRASIYKSGATSICLTRALFPSFLLRQAWMDVRFSQAALH